MGLRILHTADWHLDSPFAAFPDDLRTKLSSFQKEIPKRLGELICREHCDLALLAGDIFDGVPRRETVEALKRELGRWGIPVCIAPGNHDFYGMDSPWRESWPENVHIFTDQMSFIDYPSLDCRVYGGGYRSMDCPPLLENFRAEGNEAYRIALLHGDPTQRESPYSPVTVQQVRESGLDYLALGHIHKAGAFRAGNTLCVWPGCPMGRGWDETGDKGVCIVTLEEEARVQAVTLDTVRFWDLEAEAGADPLSTLEALLPGEGSEDFYRITLTGSGSVDGKALAREFPDFPNLELRDNTEPPVDLWADTDEDTLEGLYFQMLRRAMEDQPENARRVELAAEISRKLLLGREVRL